MWPFKNKNVCPSGRVYMENADLVQENTALKEKLRVATNYIETEAEKRKYFEEMYADHLHWVVCAVGRSPCWLEAELNHVEKIKTGLSHDLPIKGILGCDIKAERDRSSTMYTQMREFTVRGTILTRLIRRRAMGDTDPIDGELESAQKEIVGLRMLLDQSQSEIEDLREKIKSNSL